MGKIWKVTVKDFIGLIGGSNPLLDRAEEWIEESEFGERYKVTRSLIPREHVEVIKIPYRGHKEEAEAVLDYFPKKAKVFVLAGVSGNACEAPLLGCLDFQLRVQGVGEGKQLLLDALLQREIDLFVPLGCRRNYKEFGMDGRYTRKDGGELYIPKLVRAPTREQCEAVTSGFKLPDELGLHEALREVILPEERREYDKLLVKA